MESIFRIFFRQTEELLRLTKTGVHAFQLQHHLDDELHHLFINDEHRHCAFTYDLYPELRLCRTHLHSTCFQLQRALYRLQASRQRQKDSPIHENLLRQYDEDLAIELRILREILSAAIDEFPSANSSLIVLENLFKQLEENYQILRDYVSSATKQKSLSYLGNLVSDTSEKFSSIVAELSRLILQIEKNKKNQ